MCPIVCGHSVWQSILQSFIFSKIVIVRHIWDIDVEIFSFKLKGGFYFVYPSFLLFLCYALSFNFSHFRIYFSICFSPIHLKANFPLFLVWSLSLCCYMSLLILTYLCVYIFISVSLCVDISFSLFLCECVSISPCFSINVCLYLSVSLSLFFLNLKTIDRRLSVRMSTALISEIGQKLEEGKKIFVYVQKISSLTFFPFFREKKM